MSTMLPEVTVKVLLEEVEADERLYYPTATIRENAPLAMIQHELEVKSYCFRKILGLPYRSFTKERRDVHGDKR